VSPSQSCVDFPSSSANPSHCHVRPPHLPFRRILLPTPPVFPQRLSVASVASFDSLPEDQEGGVSEAADVSSTILTPNSRPYKSSLPSSSTSHLPASTNRSRLRSIEPPQGRRHKGRRAKDSSEAADDSITSNVKLESGAIKEAREKKRGKIIREFYDTEKTYVDGLDFIYHVRRPLHYFQIHCNLISTSSRRLSPRSKALSLCWTERI
jgi:FYVE/RhoGEF/PH domain-containing protein 5/6